MSKDSKPLACVDQAALVFPKTIEQMSDALEQLGLKPLHRDWLNSDAARLVNKYRVLLSPLKQPPSLAERELLAFTNAMQRSRKALQNMGELGMFRLAQGHGLALAQREERPGLVEGFIEVTRLVGAILKAEDAAKQGALVPPEYFRMPRGQREIARAKREHMARFLADLDIAFEIYAGHRPPRSEYTDVVSYPWFRFCQLAAAPLGAPQSNEGFRRLFRLAVKVGEEKAEP